MARRFIDYYLPAVTVAVAFYGLSTALFVYRRNHEVIRPRMPFLTAAQGVGSALLGCVSMLHILLDADSGNKTQCLLFGAPYTLLATFWCLLLFVRVSNLLFMYAINQTTLQFMKHSELTFYQNLNIFARSVIRGQLYFHEQRVDPRLFRVLGSMEKVSDSATDPNILLLTVSRRMNIKLLTVTVILGSLSSGFIIILQILFFRSHERMGLCRPVDYTFISVFVFIVLYLINPYLIFALRRVSDNYGIKRELVIAITSFITLYTVHLLGVFGVIPLLPYGLTYNWVVPVSTTLCHTVLVVWPTIASFHHTANPVSSNGHQLAYNQESFEKALKDPELYGRFKEVVAQDFCTENVAYHEFYLQLADMPVVPEQAVELLKTRFLNPGAPQELNLSSAVKKKLLHRLDDPTQVKDVLKTIHDDVAVLLYTNSFPKFIKRERILVSTHAHV